MEWSSTPALLDVLHVTAGVKANLRLDNGRLAVLPQTKPNSTMAELLPGALPYPLLVARQPATCAAINVAFSI
jgi:hypothetical protein